MEWMVRFIGSKVLTDLNPTEIISLIFIILMFSIFLIKGTIKIMEVINRTKNLSGAQPVLQQVIDQHIIDKIAAVSIQLDSFKAKLDSTQSISDAKEVETHILEKIKNIEERIIRELATVKRQDDNINDILIRDIEDHKNNIRALIEKIESNLISQLHDFRNEQRNLNRDIQELSKDFAQLNGIVISAGMQRAGLR